MQLVRQHRATMRPFRIGYVLKTLPLLFGALVVASYGYTLTERLASDTLRPSLLIWPIITIVPFLLGWLINRKQPGHTIAFLFLVMAYSSSVLIFVEWRGLLKETLPARYIPLIDSSLMAVGHIMWLPGIYVPLFLMPLYFPTGKLLSPRWRLIAGMVVLDLAWSMLTVILRPWPWPEWGIMETRPINGIAGSAPFFDAASKFLAALFIPLFPFISLSMFLRYRRSRGIERIQMKWPVFAVLCFLGLSVILLFFPVLMDIDEQLDYVMTWSITMLFPLAIGIAMLRHGLWDIDIILSRTLVYGSLSALIIAVYILIVGGAGVIFHTQTNTISGLVATGIIAVLFQPVRGRLQRGVNRLLYGQRDDPAAVLTQVAQQLGAADIPTEILPNLVQTIALTLKIPYVAIWLPAEMERMGPAASWGKAPANRQVISLIYKQETIGRLEVAPRGPHEQFTQTEQGLLAAIASLTTTTVRAVQLSEELQRSRRRIVATREDERRRLRRDLHDGLGAQLASQMLGLEAVAQLMPSDPEKAQKLLDSLKSQAEEAIMGVRRVVYDLRPPALDDLGLVGALKQRAARYESEELRFNLDLPDRLLELPAATEAAVFYIAQEALTNVVHHAQATLCDVRLYQAEGQLVVEIRDNGQGLAADHPSGVGLQAMKERAAELNGTCEIESLPDGGTLVRARLPLDVSDG